MSDDKLSVTGRIDAAVYNTTDVPDSWDTYTDSEKIAYLRSQQPTWSQTDYNTTTVGMNEYFAKNLDGSQAVNKNAEYLAIGDDSTGATESDTSLTNEVFRKEVTDYLQKGDELTCTTFIGSSDANGVTFREVGLFAGPNESDTMFNHSTISDIAKDESRSITLDVTLTFSAV